MEHPIGSMMQTTMMGIKDMVDVNTVVGDPIEALGGATIIPVSKVSFGYVTGGSDLPCNEKTKLHPPMEETISAFAGGGGAGVSVQPVGFLVVHGDDIRMLPAQSLTVADRMVELLPGVVEDVKHLFAKPENQQRG